MVAGLLLIMPVIMAMKLSRYTTKSVSLPRQHQRMADMPSPKATNHHSAAHASDLRGKGNIGWQKALSHQKSLGHQSVRGACQGEFVFWGGPTWRVPTGRVASRE